MATAGSAQQPPCPCLPLTQALGLSQQTLESAWDPATGLVLLADEDGTGSRVIALDPATRSARWATPRGAFKSSCNGIATLPAQGLVFASAFFEDVVYVHRLSDGARVASFGVRRPESLAADASSGTLYVATIVSGSYASFYADTARFGVAAWRWAPAASGTEAAVATGNSAVGAGAADGVPRGSGDAVALPGGALLLPLGIIGAAGEADTCRPLAVLHPARPALQAATGVGGGGSWESWQMATQQRGGAGSRGSGRERVGSTGSGGTSSTRSLPVISGPPFQRDGGGTPPLPSAAAFGPALLLVGTFSPPSIRVLSLPDCTLLRTHRLPPSVRVAGLAADPAGNAVVVMDGGPAGAALVLEWPLPCPLQEDDGVQPVRPVKGTAALVERPSDIIGTGAVGSGKAAPAHDAPRSAAGGSSGGGPQQPCRMQ